ncbi:MAG: hypothetical protein R3B90_00385 [Planctomycetaceae bacterium]
MPCSLVATSLLAAERNDWLPAIVVGALLVLLGGWFLRMHLAAWRAPAADHTLGDTERRHYRRQFWRRMQASSLIALIGLLLPAGDQLLRPERVSQAMAAVFWLLVLALTCWVLLLAIVDIIATRSHSQITLSRIQQKQMALNAEADRLRS